MAGYRVQVSISGLNSFIFNQTSSLSRISTLQLTRRQWVGAPGPLVGEWQKNRDVPWAVSRTAHRESPGAQNHVRDKGGCSKGLLLTQLTLCFCTSQTFCNSKVSLQVLWNNFRKTEFALRPVLLKCPLTPGLKSQTLSIPRDTMSNPIACRENHLPLLWFF